MVVTACLLVAPRRAARPGEAIFSEQCRGRKRHHHRRGRDRVEHRGGQWPDRQRRDHRRQPRQRHHLRPMQRRRQRSRERQGRERRETATTGPSPAEAAPTPSPSSAAAAARDDYAEASAAPVVSPTTATSPETSSPSTAPPAQPSPNPTTHTPVPAVLPHGAERPLSPAHRSAIRRSPGTRPLGTPAPQRGVGLAFHGGTGRSSRSSAAQSSPCSEHPRQA